MARKTLRFYNEPYDAVEHNRMMLQSALQYITDRYRILPLHTVQVEGDCTCGRYDCTSIGKHPRTQNGLKDASSDQEQVRSWWRNMPRSNIGLATGNGLVVIDIDPRHGGSLEELRELAPLPTTTTVSTGGGGWHLYFTYDPHLKIPNSAGLLGEGIDVRGDGGYVVAPPSVHVSGRTYIITVQARPAPLPQELLRLLLAPKAKPAVKNAPAEALTGQALQEHIIREGQRNNQLFSLASDLRRWGASDEVVKIALNAANATHCQPPLITTEVQQIVSSSQRYEKAPVAPLQLIGHLEATNLQFPEPKWAIEGIVSEGVTLLAGKPKVGKSWLALSLAIAVACGSTALGRLPSTQGEVLYLALEDGPRRVIKRTQKLLQEQPWPQALLACNTCPPLLEGGLESIEAWLQQTPTAQLVIIDTLVRARAQKAGSAGGSMYNDDYAGILPIKELADRYQVAIMLVHHLNKRQASDPMDEISGSTGLTGATDCNMVLRRDPYSGKCKLYITGRDVEEQEWSIVFDKETAQWSLVEDPTDEDEHKPAVSEARQEVIELLRQKERPVTPAEVARELGREPANIRKTLAKLLKIGEVRQANRGKYEINQPSLTLL